MNIFHASFASINNNSIPESQLWDVNLRQTLLAMGHTVFTPSYNVGAAYMEARGALAENRCAVNASTILAIVDKP